MKISFSAIIIALLIFIAIISRFIIRQKRRDPNDKIPLSDDIQRIYYDKYEQEIKQPDQKTNNSQNKRDAR